MNDSQALMAQLQQRFDPQAAGSLEAVFQYRVDETDHSLSIAGGRCELAPGAAEDPDATLTLGADTLQALLAGEVGGMDAFMAGHLKIGGDMMLAMRLTELFPVR